MNQTTDRGARIVRHSRRAVEGAQERPSVQPQKECRETASRCAPGIDEATLRETPAPDSDPPPVAAVEQWYGEARASYSSTRSPPASAFDGPQEGAVNDPGPTPTSTPLPTGIVVVHNVITHNIKFANHNPDVLEAMFHRQLRAKVDVILGQGVTRNSHDLLTNMKGRLGYDVYFSENSGGGHGHNFVALRENVFQCLDVQKDVNLGVWEGQNDKFAVMVFCRCQRSRSICLFGSFHTPGSSGFKTRWRVEFGQHVIKEVCQRLARWRSVIITPSDSSCQQDGTETPNSVVVFVGGRSNLTGAGSADANRDAGFTHWEGAYSAYVDVCSGIECLVVPNDPVSEQDFMTTRLKLPMFTTPANDAEPDANDFTVFALHPDAATAAKTTPRLWDEGVLAAMRSGNAALEQKLRDLERRCEEMDPQLEEYQAASNGGRGRGTTAPSGRPMTPMEYSKMIRARIALEPCKRDTMMALRKGEMELRGAEIQHGLYHAVFDGRISDHTTTSDAKRDSEQSSCIICGCRVQLLSESEAMFIRTLPHWPTYEGRAAVLTTTRLLRDDEDVRLLALLGHRRGESVEDPGNCLVMCGTAATEGTCHHLFAAHRLALVPRSDDPGNDDEESDADDCERAKPTLCASIVRDVSVPHARELPATVELRLSVQPSSLQYRTLLAYLKSNYLNASVPDHIQLRYGRDSTIDVRSWLADVAAAAAW